MKILISGSHGLIGSALISSLSPAGHAITRLIRRPGYGVLWNPESGYIDRKAMEGFDAVIHLAAENIGSGWWTGNKKEKIRFSRINGTTLLANSIATLKRPPAVFISASATGYYGNRAAEVLDETSSPGEGFLARVCQEWEIATRSATKQAGVRVVQTRFAPVLSSQGGMLKKLILPFKLGLGAKMGSGKQYQPWIAINDTVAALEHILAAPNLSGPVNVVAPQAITNYEFSKILGEALHRPVLFSLPVPLLKFIMREMAGEVLLGSARIIPKKLVDSGFIFRYPQIELALSHLLRQIKDKGQR